MEILLSVNNLKSLCRICCEIGNYEIGKHEISMPNLGIRISVSAMFEIFCDWAVLKSAIQDLGEDYHMICSECLNNLVSCYIFNKKLKDGWMRSEQMLRDAIDLETVALDLETHDVLDKKVHDVDDIQETDQAQEVVDEQCMEEYNVKEPPICTMKKKRYYPVRRKVNKKRNQNIEITTKRVLYNMRKESSLPSTSKQARREQTLLNNMVNKNKSRELEMEDFGPNNHSTAGTYMPNLDDAVLIVSNFLSGNDDMNDTVHRSSDPSIHKICTVEYGAVEIKYKDLHNMNNIDSAITLSTTNQINGDTVYSCTFCNVIFSVQQLLKAHLLKYHVCQYCTISFKKPEDLYQHVHTHHQQHQCVICKKNYTTNTNLKVHIRKMHGIKIPAHVSLLGIKEGSCKEEICMDELTYEQPSYEDEVPTSSSSTHYNNTTDVFNELDQFADHDVNHIKHNYDCIEYIEYPEHGTN
ncbi:uncharacterized protein LOC119662380 [Teleopsis dalmanni]|uniref:uncharacterized protein LOC119662380 n=1 Tax=Teleopsis dalmanni TaxID=139649 RepID=UPI0018CED2D7|nr:uncharacterized protein LOC119662380 [Teleopsis dalmanni]